MTRSLRIAVLECDTPLPAITDRLGGYGEIFTRLLNKGLKESGETTVEIQDVSKWNVVNNPVFPEVNEFDALLISGSSMYFPPHQSRLRIDINVVFQNMTASRMILGL
jgi:GMP synthase (glutamine-hydrolysing)